MAGKGRMPGDGRGQQGGGRKAGTPNRVTRQMRELLAKFCEENYDEFVATFHSIRSPKDKCSIYLKAQEFVTPKLATVDIKDATERKSYQDELDEMSKIPKP